MYYTSKKCMIFKLLESFHANSTVFVLKWTIKINTEDFHFIFAVLLNTGVIFISFCSDSWESKERLSRHLSVIILLNKIDLNVNCQSIYFRKVVAFKCQHNFNSDLKILEQKIIKYDLH